MIYPDKVLAYLDKYPQIRVVSFDVFDTLLERRIPSEWVSRLAAAKLAISLGNPFTPQFILDHRRNSQTSAQQAKREWQLRQWLGELARDHQLPESQVVKQGSQAELTAEHQSLRLAETSRDLLDTLAQHNLRLIALSDMWLEEACLATLLERFGIHFDDVYTSCTQGHSKRHGSIFPHIIRQLGIHRNEILHLGDNLLNDVIQPHRHGWHSLWMPQARHRFPPKMPSGIKKRLRLATPDWKVLVELLEAEPDGDTDIVYTTGYRHLAPFLMLFSLMQWRIFHRDKIEHAFYLARDARLLLDAYDLLAEYLPGSPPRHYLRISRRAVALAHPDNLLLNVLPLPGKIGRKTVGEWIENFTITPFLKQAILSEANVEETTAFMPAQPALKRATQKLQSWIDHERDQLLEHLRLYLIQTAKTTSLSRIGLVDSGWAGTIQDCLRTALPPENGINGFYLGVSKQGLPPSSNNLKYGLLRHDWHPRPWDDPWQGTAGVLRLWDTLLSTDETSTEALAHQENEIQPISGSESPNAIRKHFIQTLHHGVLSGIKARLKTLPPLVEIGYLLNNADIERAATFLATKLTTHPDHAFAKAVLQLTLDEGTSRKTKTHLGWRGIRNGTVWFPGLASVIIKKSGGTILTKSVSAIYQLITPHRHEEWKHRSTM